MKSRGDEMKKSVIITIIVIYVLAIVVVGFIGLKMKVYDEQKYVEKIECISDAVSYTHLTLPTNSRV